MKSMFVCAVIGLSLFASACGESTAKGDEDRDNQVKVSSQTFGTSTSPSTGSTVGPPVDSSGVPTTSSASGDKNTTGDKNTSGNKNASGGGQSGKYPEHKTALANSAKSQLKTLGVEASPQTTGCFAEKIIDGAKPEKLDELNGDEFAKTLNGSSSSSLFANKQAEAEATKNGFSCLTNDETKQVLRGGGGTDSQVECLSTTLGEDLTTEVANGIATSVPSEKLLKARSDCGI